MLAVSGDEMMTDSFPSTVVDDVVLKVETRMVVKDALDVNIGGNPTAEGGDLPYYRRFWRFLALLEFYLGYCS